MSLPNILTICRIAAIPAIVVLVVLGSTAALWIALALYIAAAVTDYIDGALARRMNLSSNLGRMLDPIADKMLVGALIVTFAATGQIAGWDLA
ncbi:MAG: CDP-alcohol phosphatidyltransferase family protein, partial [Cucumibacter sp.]